jgi:hypothetical protein
VLVGGLELVVLVNVATTARRALPISVQGPVPVHPPPLHPSNREPALGAAVSVTTALLLREASVHPLPQRIPAGELLTVPLPLPDLVTVRLSVAWAVVAHTSLE